jgi:hypothetical protein
MGALVSSAGRDMYATYVLKQVDGGKIVSNCSANVEELEKALARASTSQSGTDRAFPS